MDIAKELLKEPVIYDAVAWERDTRYHASNLPRRTEVIWIVTVNQGAIPSNIGTLLRDHFRVGVSAGRDIATSLVRVTTFPPHRLFPESADLVEHCLAVSEKILHIVGEYTNGLMISSTHRAWLSERALRG